MSSPPSSDNPYVRIAQPHEYEEVARVLTRAFAHDPAMNWYGCVKEMVPPLNNTEDLPDNAKNTLRKLHIFQLALVRATILSGGIVTVAVVPKKGEGKSTAPVEEAIAGTTLWLKPGQSMNFSILTIIRSGFWKVFWAWGLAGAKRLAWEFSPAVEKSLKKSFMAHSADRMDSWHLLSTVVDPAYEGKGMCRLMMRDGFERTSPKPVHLEATTPRSRSIYERYGFEIDEAHQFGRGAVDEHGVSAKGDAATGYPEWVMTKWKYT